MDTIRAPKQQRAIEKKDRIITAGFNLICQNGYYNTNTQDIAKSAGVSTGIIYQYFKDKYDIFLSALEKYGDSIFFPMLKVKNITFAKDEFEDILHKMINNYINNHQVSKTAHEEITAMIHSDKEVAKFYYQKELDMTNSIKELLLNNGFKSEFLDEKVHIMIGLIDNLCHEVIYHKHETMDYNTMTNIVINLIKELFKSDLEVN